VQNLVEQFRCFRIFDGDARLQVCKVLDALRNRTRCFRRVFPTIRLTQNGDELALLFDGDAARAASDEMRLDLAADGRGAFGILKEAFFVAVHHAGGSMSRRNDFRESI